MRAVVDTNVIISAVLTPTGTPAHVLRLWRHQRFALIVSPALLAENQRALNYPKIRLRHGSDTGEVEALMREIRALATVVSPTTPIDIIQSDPSDNRLLECALASDAQIIVSGDRHLRDLRQNQNVRVMSPAAFVLLLESNGGHR